MRLVDLKQICTKLNIKPIPTKHRLNPDRYELSIDDCIKAIQGYSVTLLKEKNIMDSNLDFILKLKSPMLAGLISKESKDIINNIWNDNNKEWIFEKKIDGIRCFLAYNHLHNKYYIYSRALDPSTLLPIDYSNRIDITSNPIPFDFILDSELVFENNIGHIAMEELLEDKYNKLSKYKPKFIIFDLIKLGEYSLIGQTLEYRRREAFKVTNYLKQNNCNRLEFIEEKPIEMTKEEYYNYVIQQGYEGIIAKNLNSVYDINGKRNGSWVKIKRMTYEGFSNLLNDTYDLFITGATFLNNQVSGLILSSYKVDSNNDFIYDKYGNRLLLNVGILYDLSNELKKTLTINDNNVITLNSQFLNRVVEVSSSGYNDITGKLTNLKFICWRFDKTYESCKFNLNS